jgi:hypothetical protein
MIIATLLILVLDLYMIKLVPSLNMINASLLFYGGYDNLRPTVFFVALTFERIKDHLFFVFKRYANLVFDTTCFLLNLSKALYSLSAKKP